MTPKNVRVALATLRPHPRNYNRHPPSQIERIAASLRKFGQVRSIVVWRSTILAGLRGGGAGEVGDAYRQDAGVAG